MLGSNLDLSDLVLDILQCYDCVEEFVDCGLKAEHGNIMDVLFFFVLSDMSLSLLPKQLIAKIVQFCM